MNPGRIFVGAVLLGLGGILLAGQLGAIDSGAVLAQGWPAVILALGLLQFVLDPQAKLSSLVLVGSGLVLLAATTGVIGGDVWRILLPLGLIAAGLWVALARPHRGMSTNDDQTVHMFVALSARRTVARSQELRAGSASVFLGSGQLDLSEARPGPDGARFGATVVLGGLEVIVPEGWAVTLRGVPLIGGWDDTTRRDGIPADAPRLDVGGLVVLGGLEVRHTKRWG